jgi:polysaccharide biosynthesis/export protein
MTALVIGATTLSCCMFGCLRYIAPINPTDISKDGTEKKVIYDDNAFLSYETEQERRRTRLLQTRSDSLKGGGYRLGAGDTVQVQVFDVPELNVQARIQSNGLISLPLVGSLPAARLTLAELQKSLAGKLTSFVRAPNVLLKLVQNDSQKIAVIGEVKNPGVYPLRDGVGTLIQAIALAGGRTERAGDVLVVIPSQETTSPHAALSPISSLSEKSQKTLRTLGVEFSFSRASGSHGEQPVAVPLWGGDTVVIKEAGRFEVDGEVKRPGTFPLTREVSLLGALATAGGMSYSANYTDIQVIRDLGDGQFAVRSFNLSEFPRVTHNDLPLRNGDLVRVNSAKGRFFTRQIIESLNRFLTFNIGGNLNNN